MVYCKACGMELGDPEVDLHDPEGLSDIAQEVIGGPIENEDAHLKVVDGPKGWRYYCRPTGKVTTIESDVPAGEGEGEAPKPERGQGPEQVYDIQEEKSHTQLLAETVTNPTYGLNEGQVDEIKEWAEIYDGRLPPDVLEKVARNFDGVAKQTASLMREKYEAKLNRWMREQSEDTGGPPIGVMSSPPRGSSRQSGRGAPQPSPEPTREQAGQRTVDEVRRERRKERRRRAMERRQDALDEATSEAVKEGIQELTGTIRDARGLINTILRAKAEKDPDWFFENIDMLEALGQPSEARKEELEAMGDKLEVDREVDDALRAVQGEQPDKTEQPPTEQQEMMPEETEEADEFDELFGDIEAEMEAGQ